MSKTFLEFVQNKGSGNHTTGTDDPAALDAESSPITSKITLGDNNDFPPFMVSDDPNSQFYGKNAGLAPLIRAFKKGGNWGWSKEEKTGEDKPVKMGGKKLFLTGGALRDHLFGKKARNIELVTNCLRADTKILTLEYGPIEIAKIIGKEITVKARDGEWRKATARCYGRQVIYCLSFGSVNGISKPRSLHTVYATRNHRWFLSDGRITDDIQLGDILAPTPNPEIIPDPEAIRHGLVFRDGSNHKRRVENHERLGIQGREYPAIRLCGEDKKYLQYFSDYVVTYPPHASGDPVVYIGRKSFWKDFPYTIDPSYIAGFIRGWWLADGSKTYNKNSRNEQIEISTVNAQALNWLREYAPYANYVVTGYSIHVPRGNCFPNAKPLYSIWLAKNVRRKLYGIEKIGEEEVYCIEEPVTTGFVLANGLVTGNCSPDEIYHILVQNGFQFIGEEGAVNQAPQCKLSFSIKRQDKRGRPYSFSVKSKNDEYELSVFTKTHKGEHGQILEPGSHADDASSRDFTINAMYLLLSNDNGPNKELFDFYGGMRHLLDGRIAPVGNLQQKLKEDPMRAFRYARMLARYGDPRKIPEDERNIVKASADFLTKLKPEDLMDEFMKGMNYEDIDPRMYLKIYNHLGLLSSLFPGLNLDTHFPKELRELGDKHAPIAWMLRVHTPEDVEARLSTIWRPSDLKKILFFIKSLQKLDDNMDDATLEDLVQSYLQSGLSSRKLKLWASRLGGKSEALVDAFLQHAQSPRVRVYAGDTNHPTDSFSDLQDPFSGEVNNEAAETRKRNLEWQNFQKLLHPELN